MALAAIAKSANPNKLKCRIFYDGIIGHQENRTMVNLLDIRMEKIDPQAVQDCTHIALVDSPGPGVNNSLSPRTRVSIVIDHHKDGHGQEGALFPISGPASVRRRASSPSTSRSWTSLSRGTWPPGSSTG